MSFKRVYGLTFLLLLMPIVLQASLVPRTDVLEQIRAYTRSIEFDYVSWTWNAIGIKLGDLALGTINYLAVSDKPGIVLEALDLTRQINQLEGQITEIYGDPKISDPDTASQGLREQLANLKDQLPSLESLAESILQQQVDAIATEAGLTLGGQAFPPVMYHITPLPNELIISPRDVIRQDHSISILPDLTADQMETLEGQVDDAMDVSSLVVQVGGIGVYPTMVMETTDINWLVEVIAHEWVHNYLTLRPLGFSYMNSPELRTMNETVAAIAGKELGRMVIAQYYPQYLPQPAPEAPAGNSAPAASPPVFNFNQEMHTTRLTVDSLLAEGKVSEAETYMEQRRQTFWEQGYHLRKLNQAYFAFYGAYADQPGGAAGEDPVGAAVRLLRDRSKSLKDFINRMSWMWNFNQLEKATGN